MLYKYVHIYNFHYDLRPFSKIHLYSETFVGFFFNMEMKRPFHSSVRSVFVQKLIHFIVQSNIRLQQMDWARISTHLRSNDHYLKHKKKFNLIKTF